jgi:polysaccharide biosynthesis protein PslH
VTGWRTASKCDWPAPFAAETPAIVFTGTMDYRPDGEAVGFFATEVMPRSASLSLAPHFLIVGANPSLAVRTLTELPRVHVTGGVRDTRPYLAHAAVAVAPLRIAPGNQNKILEAMAARGHLARGA